jgi:hypothetical protein
MLQKNKNLDALFLIDSDPRVHDRNLSHLTRLRALRIARLKHEAIDFESLRKLPLLECLCVVGFGNEPSRAEQFGTLRSLKYLVLTTNGGIMPDDEMEERWREALPGISVHICYRLGSESRRQSPGVWEGPAWTDEFGGRPYFSMFEQYRDVAIMSDQESDVAVVERNTQLESLTLNGPRWETEMLRLPRLDRLPSLRTLTLAHWTKLDDAVLNRLFDTEAEIRISRLNFSGCTDIGEMHDCRFWLPNIEEIEITRRFSEKAWNSRALRGLLSGRMPKLRTLKLQQTDVDDELIDVLADIKSLETVSVGGTKMTSAGVARLKRLRPDLTIQAWPNQRALP